MHLHEICATVKVVVPYMLFNHRLGEHLAYVAHEILKERKLFGGELDGFTCPGYAMGCDVKDKIGDMECDCLSGSSTQQGPDPCDKFCDCKRFNQVVIAASVQARDTVMNRAFRCQDKHWGSQTPLALGL